MRHRQSGRQLNRNSSHRRAMFRNMTASIIKHETIRTTLPKAKELRRYIEPLITMAKTDSVANRRRAFDRLRDKEAVGKLFTELGPHFKERPGGYVRVLRMGERSGDAAPMALAAAGLHVGRQVTSHPQFRSHLQGAEQYLEHRVVVDGPVVTSRSPGTAMEFALTLVGLLRGGEVECELERSMLVERATEAYRPRKPRQ